MTPRAAMIWVAGTVASGLTIWGAWVQMGGAVPATKQLLYETASGLEDQIKKVEADGKQHSEESAKWGRKIYNKELHDLLVLPPPTDPVQRQYLKENIEDAQKWRKFYSDKEIELRKK